jgi:signal recognition particle-docking protein FtsY
MCPSDLLLLDEPTNHLDLDAIIWLEDWLKRYTGTLIVISHDRDFLDGVVNVIVHIDERKLKRYSGNYSSFERQRAAQIVLAQGMLEKQQRKQAHLQSYIDRFKAQATKARQAQSRIKALARMEEIAPLRAAAEFSFDFREPLRAPNPLLTLDDVAIGYRSEEGSEKKIASAINFSLQTGQRIGLLGVNGAGKTTTIGKLAKHLQSHYQKVLLAAGDTFRAAAREQLTAWGERNQVAVIAQESGDPAAVAFDAVQAGRARGMDVVMIDTAGRLPTQLHLMDELKKIKRVVTKGMETAPHEILLVIDGNTGQNALAQVKAFDDALGLTGLVVTKLDGTAKGGVLAAIARVRPVPVYFIGVGEAIDDLQPFVASEFVDALLG